MRRSLLSPWAATVSVNETGRISSKKSKNKPARDITEQAKMKDVTDKRAAHMALLDGARMDGRRMIEKK